MTPIADVAYVRVVLAWYVELPHTPRRASIEDEALARSLRQRRVPLEVVEAALLLGYLRRSLRPPQALPLGRIRSLAYFSPLIAELQQMPLKPGYLHYLRRKARAVLAQEADPDRSPQ